MQGAVVIEENYRNLSCQFPFIYTCSYMCTNQNEVPLAPEPPRGHP